MYKFSKSKVVVVLSTSTEEQLLYINAYKQQSQRKFVKINT